METKKIKLKRKNIVKVIPIDEQKRIVSALESYNEYVKLGIFFSLLTGLRIGEMCGLRWGDIDLENGYVSIRRTIERIADLSTDTARKTKVIISDPKTDNSIRTIPLPDYLVRRIKPLKKDDSYYVLTGSCAKRADTTAFSYERQTENLALFDASLRSEAEHVTDISENHRVLI